MGSQQQRQTIEQKNKINLLILGHESLPVETWFGILSFLRMEDFSTYQCVLKVFITLFIKTKSTKNDLFIQNESLVASIYMKHLHLIPTLFLKIFIYIWFL